MKEGTATKTFASRPRGSCSKRPLSLLLVNTCMDVVSNEDIPEGFCPVVEGLDVVFDPTRCNLRQMSFSVLLSNRYKCMHTRVRVWVCSFCWFSVIMSFRWWELSLYLSFSCATTTTHEIEPISHTSSRNCWNIFRRRLSH